MNAMNRPDEQRIGKKSIFTIRICQSKTLIIEYSLSIYYYTFAPCTKNDFNSTYVYKYIIYAY